MGSKTLLNWTSFGRGKTVIWQMENLACGTLPNFQKVDIYLDY